MTTTTPLGNTVPEDSDPLGLVYEYMRDAFAFIDRLGVRKSADETVTSSTALQNDNHLSFTVQDGRRYAFDLTLLFSCASSGVDAKIGMNHPSGVCSYAVTGLDTPVSGGTFGGDAKVAGLTGAATTDSVSVGVLADLGNVCSVARVTGTFFASADGTVTLRWCQDTSSGSGLTLLAGSHLIAELIA